MPEKIYEKLFALGHVLHWMGKFEEMQAVQSLAAHLRDQGVETWEEVEPHLKNLLKG